MKIAGENSPTAADELAENMKQWGHCQAEVADGLDGSLPEHGASKLEAALLNVGVPWVPKALAVLEVMLLLRGVARGRVWRAGELDGWVHRQRGSYPSHSGASKIP